MDNVPFIQPMKLRTISVRHYKSLSDVTVELDPQITVIVGPNSVGKSNFVDAMRFLRDAARDGLDHAITSRGGITRVRQQMSGTKPFNIGLELEFLEQQQREEPIPVVHTASYLLELASVKGGNFKVTQEKEQLFVNNQEILYTKKPDRLALSTGLEFNQSYYLLRHIVTKDLKNWRFTTLYPTTLRELRAPDTDNALREDGSNWASMIRAAKRTSWGRQTLERINEMMRLVLPEFQDVQISTVGSYLVPKFRFKDADSDKVREFDPVQLSDGTLRIYGILLSLYLQPAPSLLVIEEPEQTVHPGVLAMLSEAFKEVADTVQIIITTHSPQLVDHFAPEQVRVASMVNGLTRIAPIKASQRLAVQRGLMGLGEFMAAEGLQPEFQS